MKDSNTEQNRSIASPVGVDSICDAFEADWLAATRHPDNPDAGCPQPRIEDFLSEYNAADKEVLLRELLLAEWDLRRRHGQPIELEIYQQRFPESRYAISDLLGGWR